MQEVSKEERKVVVFHVQGRKKRKVFIFMVLYRQEGRDVNFYIQEGKKKCSWLYPGRKEEMLWLYPGMKNRC